MVAITIKKQPCWERGEEGFAKHSWWRDTEASTECFKTSKRIEDPLTKGKYSEEA